MITPLFSGLEQVDDSVLVASERTEPNIRSSALILGSFSNLQRNRQVVEASVLVEASAGDYPVTIQICRQNINVRPRSSICRGSWTTGSISAEGSTGTNLGVR